MLSKRFPLAVALFVSLSICVHAQSTASIEGLVTDQDRALIVRAEITASDPEIGVTRFAVTDDAGSYQIRTVRSSGTQCGVGVVMQF